MVFIVSGDRLRKVRRAHPINWFAFARRLLTCLLKRRSLLNRTPRSLSSSFSSIRLVSGAWYVVFGFSFLPGQKRRHSNFSELNSMLTSSAHLYTPFRSSWRARQSLSASLIALVRRVSSTYDEVTLPFPTYFSMSETWRRKSIGLRTVPCGIPLITEERLEMAPLTTTACLRFLESRKE